MPDAGSRCTIDSSCVIALDHLDMVPRLSFLFSLVLVPKAVREDLFKRRESKDRLQRLFDDFDFLRRCDRYDRGAVEVLLVERRRQGSQDRGEVEAVVQAAQEGASVIVDDPWGRKLAEQYELEFHGTLWVLERFHELELIGSLALRDCLASLKERGLRLPWATVDELLTKIGQRPLAG